MVNFSLLTAEICWRVWGTPANFNGFRVLAALLHGTLVVGVSQTAALNRGCHLYLAGRPSRWALAHILVLCTLPCVEIKTEAESSDEREGDKLAAFTVLLHGSLKVEQMVAIVQLGSVFFISPP